MPVLSALADGYEVYFLTDASGGASREAHDMAVQRMIQAGTIPTTTWPYVSELQCDWARAETAGAVTKLFKEHGGGFGQELRWGWSSSASRKAHAHTIGFWRCQVMQQRPSQS